MVHWGDVGNETITQHTDSRMLAGYLAPSSHDDVGELQDKRHHGNSKRHWSAGIQKLPYNRSVFKSSGNCSMRVYKTAHLDKTDILRAD
jgi:hypothetical protein